MPAFLHFDEIIHVYEFQILFNFVCDKKVNIRVHYQNYKANLPFYLFSNRFSSSGVSGALSFVECVGLFEISFLATFGVG